MSDFRNFFLSQKWSIFFEETIIYFPYVFRGVRGGRGAKQKKTKFRVKVDKELMWDLGNCQMSHMWDRITVLK